MPLYNNAMQDSTSQYNAVYSKEYRRQHLQLHDVQVTVKCILGKKCYYSYQPTALPPFHPTMVPSCSVPHTQHSRNNIPTYSHAHRQYFSVKRTSTPSLPVPSVGRGCCVRHGTARHHPRITGHRRVPHVHGEHTRTGDRLYYDSCDGRVVDHQHLVPCRRTQLRASHLSGWPRLMAKRIGERRCSTNIQWRSVKQLTGEQKKSKSTIPTMKS